MLEKLSKMSVCIRDAMIALAGRPPMYGEQHRWLTSIAKAAGISYRTARSLWLGEIDGDEHRAARDVRRAAEMVKARNDAQALAAKFKTLVEVMNENNPGIYGEEIARLERVARLLRGEDRP